VSPLSSATLYRLLAVVNGTEPITRTTRRLVGTPVAAVIAQLAHRKCIGDARCSFCARVGKALDLHTASLIGGDEEQIRKTRTFLRASATDLDVWDLSISRGTAIEDWQQDVQDGLLSAAFDIDGWLEAKVPTTSDGRRRRRAERYWRVVRAKRRMASSPSTVR
jgi:hypothetical protein